MNEADDSMLDRQANLKLACDKLLASLLHLCAGERLLLYTDGQSPSGLAAALAKHAESMGVEVTHLRLEEAGTLPEMSDMLLRAVDETSYHAVCELSSNYFYPTPAWSLATRGGARVYSLGAMSIDSFIRCVGRVDLPQIRELGDWLYARLRDARSIEITTEAGSKLELRLKAPTFLRRGLSRLGLMGRSNVWSPSGFPSPHGGATFLTGQVALVGVPASMRGRWVVDDYLWPPKDIGKINQPLELSI